MVKLLAAAQEAGGKQAMGAVESLTQRLDAGERESELRRIAKEDPWVLSPKGFDTLKQVREQNPFVNDSPTPWQTALELAKGRGLVPTKSATPVATPNPTPKGAPSTPPSGAQQTTVTPKPTDTVNLDNPEELKAALDKMTPEDQDKFWISQGFPKMHGR